MTETHTFKLIFAIPGVESVEPHLDALFNAGCDDAAITGPASDGTFGAEFDREASTFSQAVVSAIDQVQSGIPGLRVLRVEPDDLVTISAIAKRTGRTDESVRLLESGERGPGGFPPALGRLNDKTRVWRWSQVAEWFADALGQPPPQSEHAAFLAALNNVLQLGQLTDSLKDHPDELQAIARLLPRREELEVTGVTGGAG